MGDDAMMVRPGTVLRHYDTTNDTTYRLQTDHVGYIQYSVQYWDTAILRLVKLWTCDHMMLCNAIYRMLCYCIDRTRHHNM